MITYPNCKINIGLHIVGKRPDGYHDLETIFLPVLDMCDELEITPLPPSRGDGEGISLGDGEGTPRIGEEDTSIVNGEGAQTTMQQDGIALDNKPEDNLCMKAWMLLHDEYNIPPVNIRLKKNIPFGAGLGGGSSDAAFTLKMLNEMFAIGLDTVGLERRAARLGADCAFFIKNQTAYATGIGDQLEPIEWRVGSGDWRVIIEIPEGEHVSTREAYAGLQLGMSQHRCDLREALKHPIEEWRHLIVNDFEASVFPSHPAIATLKDDMYRRGAIYASMTGSGAAVFGIFKK